MNVVFKDNIELLFLNEKLTDYNARKEYMEELFTKNDSNMINYELNFIHENIKILQNKYIEIQLLKLEEYNCKITIKCNVYLIETDDFLIILYKELPIKKPSFYIRSIKDNININYEIAIDCIFDKAPKKIKILYFIKNKLDNWNSQYELHQYIPYLNYLGNLLNRTLLTLDKH